MVPCGSAAVLERVLQRFCKFLEKEENIEENVLPYSREERSPVLMKTLRRTSSRPHEENQENPFPSEQNGFGATDISVRRKNQDIKLNN